MPDRRLRGMEVRYDGRTLRFEVYVNTDAPCEDVFERLLQAAKGPKLDMAIVVGDVIPCEQAAELWLKMISNAREYVGEKKS